MKVSPAIRAALKGHDPSDEQWAAIAHDSVPVLVVAGAGSGKTAIMAARMVWMTEEGIARPSQILGLTFTNKAARELEERIAAAFAEFDPHPQEEPYIATYHSFADRLVREHGVRVGIDPEVGLLTEAQRWQLLLGEFDSLPPFDAVDSRSMASIVRSALSLADQCANHLVNPEKIISEDERILQEGEQFPDDVILASRRRIELSRVVRAYIDAKSRVRRIDFGDQVSRAVEILERFADLCEALKERYPAILLDEYQDTNVAQRRLMQLLAPHGHNITAVGDARQNIFQWRGSTLYNLIDFPTKHFLRLGATPHEFLSLSENYRCGSRILEVANDFIDHVPKDRRPGLPLSPHDANGEGAVRVKLLADQLDEASFIASEIGQLHGSATAEGREPAAWKDFAILVRRKAHIASIYDALVSRRIPVEVVGLGGLLQVPEVMDAVAWLRVLADPTPTGNRWLARILLGPRFRIHYRDMALLARWAQEHTRKLQEAKKAEKGEKAGDSSGVVDAKTDLEPDNVAYSLAEALDSLEMIEEVGSEARRRFVMARSEIKNLREKASGPLLEFVQRVIRETGIAEAVETRSDNPASNRANLTSFLGVVSDFSPISGDPSLGAFLAYLDAAEDVEETLDLSTPAGTDSVKLMTVHQAKGLEFEVVFVPSVAARDNERGEKVDSIFPDTRTSNPMTSYSSLPHSVREDAEHLPTPWDATGKPKRKAQFGEELKQRAIEDERRLFYVALTRAKQLVYVTAAWWYERQSRIKGPSLFFEEVASAPAAEVLEAAEPPDANPLLVKMAERAIWPPPPRSLVPDALWPDGYPETLERLLAGDFSVESLLDRLEGDERTHADEVLSSHRESIKGLVKAREERSGNKAKLPQSLSATRVVDLLSERVTPTEVLRPLPERPSAAQRIGTEVHRWIEEVTLGLTGLADEEALDAPSIHMEPSKISDLKRSFGEMGFLTRKIARLDSGEPMSELRFVLKVGERLVRGRIDAVYETDEGRLEIVDFKTGAEVEVPEVDQLKLYAAALTLIGVEIKGPLRLTYCFLASGKQVSTEIDVTSAGEVVSRMEDALAVL